MDEIIIASLYRLRILREKLLSNSGATDVRSGPARSS